MDRTTCVLSFLLFIILVTHFRSELFSVSKGKNGTITTTRLPSSVPYPPKDSDDVDGVVFADIASAPVNSVEWRPAQLKWDRAKKDSHTMEKIVHNLSSFSCSFALRVPSPFTRDIFQSGISFILMQADSETFIKVDDCPRHGSATAFKHDIFMIVPNIRHDKRKDMWIFMKPLSWDLWLTMGIASIFVGLAIRFLECRVNSAEFGGSLHHQLFMLFWFPFSSLFHMRRMANKWSKVVVFIWLSIAFIVMQCYVAMLIPLLTENQQQQALPKQYNYIGYRKCSFVKEVLMEQFGFIESQLKSYSTIDEYPAALSRGNQNAGVNAIFDEEPYINLFLRKYHSKYTVVGPISKATGFGFAFPSDSHYQFHFPRTILDVDESPKVNEIREQREHQDPSQYQPVMSSPQSPSINAYSFGGLFIIAAIAIIIAIVCSEYSLWKTSIQTLPSITIESSVESAVEMINVSEDMPIIDHQEHPPASNQSNVEASINETEEDEEAESL